MFLAFVVLIILAIVSFFKNLFSSAKNRRAIICSVALILASGAAIFSARYQQNMAADWFFMLNAPTFKKMLANNPADPARTVYRRSSAPGHKLIVFIRAAEILDGRQGAATVESLGPALYPFYSCSITARRLKDRFYLLTAGC